MDGTAGPGFTLSCFKMKVPIMRKDPKPTRGMPRSLFYAMIPAGFLLLILILVFTGFWTQEVTDSPGVMQEPAGTQQPAETQEPAGTLD